MRLRVTTKPSICLIFTACTADAVLKKRAATTATVYILSFSRYWAKRCWRGLTRQWDEIGTFSGKDCSPCALRQCRPPSLKPWSSPMRSWSWWWEHFSSTSAAWSGLFATQNWATMRRRVEVRKKWCSARTTTLISHCRHIGAPVCSRTLRMDSRTPLMSTFGTTQTVCCQTAPRFAVKMVELSTTLEVTRTEQLVTSISTLFSLFIVYVLHHRSDLCPWTFMQCLTEVIKRLMQKLHFKLLYYTIFRFLRSRLQWIILSWIKKNVKIATKQIPLFTVSWKITAKTLALLFCVLKSELCQRESTSNPGTGQGIKTIRHYCEPAWNPFVFPSASFSLHLPAAVVSDIKPPTFLNQCPSAEWSGTLLLSCVYIFQ